MDEKLTRRKLLGMSLGVALAPTAIGGVAIYEPCRRPDGPEEEWEVGFASNMDGLDVYVWSNEDIVVRQGENSLRMVRRTKDGWQEFRGKYGTRIKLRHPGLNQLEVDYYIIVEPIGPNVEDRDYLTGGKYSSQNGKLSAVPVIWR